MSFSNPIVGGENGELIRSSIQSPDYVPGVSGWTINRDGTAEFNNVSIRIDAVVGESIVVGPAGTPQVVIAADGSKGYIAFPTNAASEVTPATVYSDIVNEGLPNERLRFVIDSGTNANGDSTILSMLSSPANGGGALMSLGTGSASVFLSDNGLMSLGEISCGIAPSNFPHRTIGGNVHVGANQITPIAGTDTLIVGGSTASVILTAGSAYEVNVRVSIRTSGTTGAAGTQRVAWTLWQGAVGGTRLGQEMFLWKTGAVTAVTENMPVDFVFEAPTSGTFTLNLACRQVTGTNVLEAFLDTNYFMHIKKIGDPARITNL